MRQQYPRRTAYAKLSYLDCWVSNWVWISCDDTEDGPRAVLREDTIPFLRLKAGSKQQVLCASAQPGGKTAWSGRTPWCAFTHTLVIEEDQRFIAVARNTDLKAGKNAVLMTKRFSMLPQFNSLLPRCD